ncbi:kinetochore protein Spc25-like isoform X2 [Gigantopelta aegis]|uniref:kinetochore protein Spc25-like isoform X2 n=1 Tax=Gigantopelta aegis TaxID=1735272 RepID=UPI001B88CCA5|nr:kinetochore protein Spc25-like isoform X2 [Gigantopelta aegis]
MMDFCTEPANLKRTLEEFRTKFLTKWIEGDLNRNGAELTEQYNEAVRQGKESIENLKKNEKQRRQQSQMSQKVLESHIAKARMLKEELTRLKTEADTRLQKKENMTEELQKVLEEKDHDSQKILAQEKTTKERLLELEKSAEWFRNNLGLQFRKISGNKLQMIFTSVDDKDPKAPCSFHVQIDDSRKYIISNCEPPVEELDCLVEKLNATNNLSGFVQAIRKAFKTKMTR